MGQTDRSRTYRRNRQEREQQRRDDKCGGEERRQGERREKRENNTGKAIGNTGRTDEVPHDGEKDHMKERGREHTRPAREKKDRLYFVFVLRFQD